MSWWGLIPIGWMSFAIPTLVSWKLTQRPNVAVDDITRYVVIGALVTGPLGLALEIKEQLRRHRTRA